MYQLCRPSGRSSGARSKRGDVKEHRTYVTTKTVHVRAGLELNSKKLWDLEAGTEIDA